ncbi:MAG: sulfatase-like hydrolase/transferase [Muribaculaceae bacterium]
MKPFNKIVSFLRRVKCNQRLLFVLCVFGLTLPNFLFFFIDASPLLVRLCNIVLPFSIWWWAMTWLRRPGKMFWLLFLFVFFDAFQIVLLDMYGGAILAVDMFLNVATTNASEVGEQLGGILPAVTFVFVVYLPLLFWSTVSIYHVSLPQRFLLRNRRMASVGIGVGVVMLIACYITVPKFSFINDIYPANVTDNLIIAVERTIATNTYQTTSKGFTFNAKSTHDPDEKEAYILVIGETARADNFGIYGYHRQTTPLLAKEENLVAYADVLSQANVTHKSVPMILSAVSAENYDSIYHQKSIITAMNEAGFATAFFSNQRPNRSFIDFFAGEAHRSVFVKQNAAANANIPDSVLVDYLKEELADSARCHKRFVVLHTYGSHFNYYDRYSNEARRYTPDRVTTIGYKNRQTMVNAYDNSIVGTDMLLHKVINETRNAGYNACVMYLSDHGEDIYDDDRRLYMHASPIPSYYQLHVPFIMWTSEGYEQNHPDENNALRANVRKPVASNLVVFHTLLGLAGVETPYANNAFSLCSPLYSSPKRYYLNDHNDPMPMNEIGLKEQDVEMLRKNKMQYP